MSLKSLNEKERDALDSIVSEAERLRKRGKESCERGNNYCVSERVILAAFAALKPEPLVWRFIRDGYPDLGGFVREDGQRINVVTCDFCEISEMLSALNRYEREGGEVMRHSPNFVPLSAKEEAIGYIVTYLVLGLSTMMVTKHVHYGLFWPYYCSHFLFHLLCDGISW